MKKLLLLLVFVALAAPASAQRGGLTVPRNLEQLTERAATIVRGTVLDARVEKHPELSGLDTIVVRLRVRETLKGKSQETFTFRQYVWDIRDRFDAAGYRKGQDLLLLMIAPSRYGLSSPAGLEQGRFRIRRDAAGNETAVNGHGNARLFDGVGAQLAKEGVALSPKSATLVATHRQGPVEVGALMDLIGELVARGR